MNWRNIDSLSLTANGWSCGRAINSLDDSQFLQIAHQTAEISPTSSRFCSNIRTSIDGTRAFIDFGVNRGGGIGCRVVADGLQALMSKRCGNPILPSKIFIRSHSGFQLRALITLFALGKATTRIAINNTLKHCVIEHSKGEKPKQFEIRASNYVEGTLHGFERLMPKSLCLKGVKSFPDGLFFNRASNRLVIVEAKQRSLGFSEGTAQVAQYYAQAMFHNVYRTSRVETFLVNSTSKQSSCYVIWRELIASRQDIGFCVWVASGKNHLD